RHAPPQPLAKNGRFSRRAQPHEEEHGTAANKQAKYRKEKKPNLVHKTKTSPSVLLYAFASLLLFAFASKVASLSFNSSAEAYISTAKGISFFIIYSFFAPTFFVKNPSYIAIRRTFFSGIIN
ncbi:hypothetical protein, partial [Ferruginibacter sp.]|uniref:hypothetical protein n=1 Tax=Ferruginibacter sp. TaxID=1940288 RepID=UPI00265B22A3